MQERNGQIGAEIEQEIKHMMKEDGELEENGDERALE